MFVFAGTVQLEASKYWLVLARQDALPEDVAVCSSERQAWKVVSEWATGMKLNVVDPLNHHVCADDDLGQEWMFHIWGPRELDQIT